MASKDMYYCSEECFFRGRKYSVGEGPFSFGEVSKGDKDVLGKRFTNKAPAPLVEEEEPKTLKELQDKGKVTPFS